MKSMNVPSLLAACLLGSLPGCQPRDGRSQFFTARADTLAKTPVIIDTDMAIDDWMAILYLLQRSDISVKAITVTGTGFSVGATTVSGRLPQARAQRVGD